MTTRELLTTTVARSRSRRTDPLRVALVGCGTMAEQFHLPVLAGHERLRLAALVDRDAARAERLALSYGVPAIYRDADQLQPDDIDAVLLCTPPNHHAPGSIALMSRGIHVFVEKPMALNRAEAESMCRVAAEHGVVLAVGVYKRLLPVTSLLRRLVTGGQYGRPVTFSAEWGGIGGYASATLGLMKRDTAGGGVLIDLGSHVFDQLLAVFGGDIAIDDYRDDARGGIEADCEVAVTFGAVSGSVRLSRVRNLSNMIRIECEQATIEASIQERFEVCVRPRNGSTTAPLWMRDTDSLDASWYESYRWEIDDFVTAIVDGHEPRLSGPSVLPTVAAIDECYARRQPLALPWFDDMPGGVVPPRATERQRRVLLTGGGGFIGGRTADVLSRRDGWTVRALVHNPGSASRLARLPVELVQGDLKSDADVARAIDGCDAVVHCAIGTAYGEPREIHAVTVDGTRRLAAAARQAGVTRFVHISSIGVHDTAFAGTIDESTPVNPPKGDWYGHTKSLAERAVRSEEARGLSVAILRPGCVYGPYGFTFVMNPLRFLAADRLVLEDCADLPANTVFVDNLVDAMMCALSAAPEAVAGQAFPISDGDSCTWGQYFDFFADRMGRVARRTTAHETGPKGDVTSRGLVGNLADTLLSMEAKQFAKKVLQSDPLGTVPRNLLARYPVLEQHARRLAGMNAPVTYRRDPPAAPDLFRMTGRRSGLSIDNARRRLAFTPPVSRADALATTWEWVTYARLL